ncbi:MAG: hypothetical protein LCH54_03765 [Bacteroidetes bacterium]|nr:hypothetical protein [Bacteroidota bacterium]
MTGTYNLVAPSVSTTGYPSTRTPGIRNQRRIAYWVTSASVQPLKTGAEFAVRGGYCILIPGDVWQPESVRDWSSKTNKNKYSKNQTPQCNKYHKLGQF